MVDNAIKKIFEILRRPIFASNHLMARAFVDKASIELEAIEKENAMMRCLLQRISDESDFGESNASAMNAIDLFLIGADQEVEEASL